MSVFISYFKGIQGFILCVNSSCNRLAAAAASSVLDTVCTRVLCCSFSLFGPVFPCLAVYNSVLYNTV